MQQVKAKRETRFMVHRVDDRGKWTWEDDDRFPGCLHTSIEYASNVARVCTRLIKLPFGVFEARGSVNRNGEFSTTHISQKRVD